MQAEHLKHSTNWLILLPLAVVGVRWPLLTRALLVGLSGWYPYQLAREMPVTHLENHSLFLVSSGIVMYFSGTVLLYIFARRFIVAFGSLGQHSITLSIF